MFKVNKGYYLEILTLETIKLLASTKSKITKNKNGENVLNVIELKTKIKIIEVALVHYNIANNNY